MALCYLVPLSFSNCTLCFEEWVITGGWIALGAVLYVVSRRRHGAQFGVQAELELEPDQAPAEKGEETP